MAIAVAVAAIEDMALVGKEPDSLAWQLASTKDSFARTDHIMLVRMGFEAHTWPCASVVCTTSWRLAYPCRGCNTG